MSFLVAPEPMVKLIADIGINHDGDFDLAKKLVQLASTAGCWAVKVQIRNPDVCVPDEIKKTRKVTKRWGDLSYLEYRKRMEFTDEQLLELKQVAATAGDIKFFASCWDCDSVRRLARLGRAYIKVASAGITDKKLLNCISKEKFGHVFLSTGMSTEQEIVDAVNIILKNRFSVLTIMHCVSVYPTPPQLMHLSRITRLREIFGDSPRISIGYSGHEIGLTPSVLAAGLGAQYIERHITYDTKADGSDHAASLTAPALRNLNELLQQVPVMLGTDLIVPLPEEAPSIKKFRK